MSIKSALASIKAASELLSADKKMTITPAQAFKIFKEEADRVWGKEEMARLTFKLNPDPPKSKHAVASLSWRGRQRRDLAFPRDKTFILSVSPDMLFHPLDVIKKFLIHEAVHIGYPRHTKAFYLKNKQVGGAVSEHEALGGKTRYFVERKEGHRFKKVYEAKDEHDAMNWYKKEVLVTPGRYRTSIER